eukprot:CAMPEP_0204311276 /NCGR_PEP_ID=MMETSP0469-20131031/2237_1 /ASSEMBLY_ACC=CAM_ASM_000384 /TAXON_ID=2969 /ORGANISM="Oxyrrhis marina" /LENGTH=110 /DNA_ID=CAMNT_0051291201 /DNA_START=94 /DNA_END=426 /DNA_ORIENTATION=+
MGLKSDAVFAKIQAGLESQGAEVVKKTNAIFAFKIKEGKNWVLDLKNGSGSLKEGEGKADATITISDEDFVAMADGKLNGMQAFMGGKLKISGNMMLAQKLGSVLESVGK